ncbi:DUF2207 domain-containing protein [Agromyces sp. H3Y2-19a]|uniref:DUF2207 family protein n=1 Tax=Agromyces chromiiresistens TaxID=3030835 RepID=UPI0023B9C0BD|nr:DUF2207 domain-containing protein [Agromyces chromiiresistens]MDF0514853.1 DUF2207 domain-containing protein [Agromyces chromiiresistens]
MPLRRPLRRALTAVVAAMVATGPLLVGVGAGHADAAPSAPSASKASSSAAGQGGAPAPVSAIGPRAGVDDFTFSSFDAVYELSLDAEGRSMLGTTETLVAEFPEFDQNRGIRRAIPLDYDGHPTDLVIESVTDGTGTPRAFETETDEDGEFLLVTIRADDFVHGRQTYVIDYRQRSVTHVPDDAAIDEFYWDVNGTGWAQPFGVVRAELRFGGALADGFTGAVACYRGWSGSSTPCDGITTDEGADGETVVVAQAASIGPYENLTIAAGFRAGTVVPRDDAFWSSPAAVGGGIAALVAVGAALAALIARLTRWRDHPGRGTIVAQYEPPEGVSAFVSADLVGQPGKGVTSTILERAVAGEVRIVETGRRRYAVEYVGGTTRADEHASAVTRALFGSPPARGAVRDLKSRDTVLGRRLLAIRQRVTKGVVAAGLRRRPDRGLRVLLGLIAVVAAALSVVLGIVALEGVMGGAWPAICFVVALAASLMTLGLVIDVRPLTEHGRELRDHLEGLRLYIRLAEADRLRVLQSPSGALRVDATDQRAVLKLNERLLPYAVLFGLERDWSRELAVLYEREGSAPEWYSGRGGFNAAWFAAGVSSFSSASSSSWSGSSSSSSSSGSGGGGSSGGGGGGGGGGGV